MTKYVSGGGVKQGETRTDQISTETIREYVKGKVKADVESKVQFAFSNSSQTLDIDRNRDARTYNV